MADEPTDFRDLLSKPLADFPDRPNLPGNKHFFGKLIGMSAGHSTNKGTPLYKFDVRLTDPGEDVRPEEIKKITDAGFNLADYQVFSNFYLTPNAMVMFRRFLISLGFNEASSFKENLSLADTGEPTAETIDKIRGLDVLVKTQPADENGRVFQTLDSIVGVKR